MREAISVGVIVAVAVTLGLRVLRIRGCLARRAAPAGNRAPAALHSMTAALVLAPLVWESTVRFGVLTPWTAALVLLFFTVFGLAISWRKCVNSASTARARSITCPTSRSARSEPSARMAPVYQIARAISSRGVGSCTAARRCP